jgi:YVTN family beta-propeller protein
VIDTDPGSSNFNKQIKVIPVGAGPYGVAASADKKLYVANHYSENISVIDVDPNSGGFNHVIANLQTGSRNRDVAVTGNSGIILITGDDGLCILEFTPGGDYSDVSVTRVNSGTGTRGVTVIPNTGLAVVTTEDGNMFIAGILPGINLGDMVAYVNTGSRARDVSASGDALFVYVTMTNPDEVAVYNLEFGSLGLPNASYFTDISLSLHHTIPLDGGPKALAIDERSEKLVVMQTTDKITEDELKEVKICCGPIPPEKSVGDLIINIQNLARSGVIDHENGNLLISKLYTVLQHLEEDDPKGAINVLNTTIKKVNQMIKKGQIDPEVGMQMIDQLEAIIAEIEAGTKSIDLATGVAPLEIPDESALGSIYPNPFTNSTIIHYQVSGGESAAVHVRLRIYNGTGQVVRDLVDQSVTQGHYTVEWDGRYHDDRPASEGIYFIEFIANDILQVRKVVKIR